MPILILYLRNFQRSPCLAHLHAVFRGLNWVRSLCRRHGCLPWTMGTVRVSSHRIEICHCRTSEWRQAVNEQGALRVVALISDNVDGGWSGSDQRARPPL